MGTVGRKTGWWTVLHSASVFTAVILQQQYNTYTIIDTVD